jgi:hypothetical protein
MSNSRCASLLIQQTYTLYNEAKMDWMKETCRLDGMKISFVSWDKIRPKSERGLREENPFRFDEQEKYVMRLKQKMDDALELKEFAFLACTPYSEDDGY